MNGRYSAAIWLAFTFGINLMGCRSKEETEEVKTHPVKQPAASVGEIHLTPEQLRLNQILTDAASETWVTPTLTALGRVTSRAGAEAQVFSPFAGRLIADPARLPRVGAHVERGQVLAEVEQYFNASERLQATTATTELQGRVQQAQQEVTFRQTELNRARQLYDGGALPLKRLQAAELNLSQARTQLETARGTQSLYEQIVAPNAVPRREAIRAPISGTIIAADLTAGAQIEPSRSLMTVVDLNTVWVEVAVHEDDLHSIGQALKARIKARGNPGHIFIGRLITIGNLVDPANRTITVTYSVDNPGANLKIGMYAEAQIPVGSSHVALTIPSSAILIEETRSSVFVESRPGFFVRRVIEPGDVAGEKTVVKSGLRLGEKVVSRGAQTLQGEASKSQIPAEDN